MEFRPICGTILEIQLPALLLTCQYGAHTLKQHPSSIQVLDGHLCVPDYSVTNSSFQRITSTMARQSNSLSVQVSDIWLPLTALASICLVIWSQFFFFFFGTEFTEEVLTNRSS